MKVGDGLHDVEEKSEQLLSQAVNMRASDIHFVPKRRDVQVKFRRDGRISDIEAISSTLAAKITSHFKFLAGMDIGEKRKPQNGALDLRSNDRDIHLRLSTLPTPFQESLVLRLLPQDDTFSLADLTLFSHHHNQLLHMARQPDGLILLTGPTGSGKTTLLYALLHSIAQSDQKQIITLEDPVEKKSDAFIQMQINEQAHMTYAEGFKSALRHDPDVLMVGEIRDDETAHLAVRAALTGHLVLSTIHTNDTMGCIYRLRELGVPLTYIAQTLRAVVAQRLVPMLCSDCDDAYADDCPSADDHRRLGLYEILSDAPLSHVLEQLTSHPDSLPDVPSFETLHDLIKTAIAERYIPESIYDYFYGDVYEA